MAGHGIQVQMFMRIQTSMNIQAVCQAFLGVHCHSYSYVQKQQKELGSIVGISLLHLSS